MENNKKSYTSAIRELEERLEFAGWGGGNNDDTGGGCGGDGGNGDISCDGGNGSGEEITIEIDEN